MLCECFVISHVALTAVECPEGMHYKASGQICDSHCFYTQEGGNATHGTTCMTKSSEGCYCPDGMVMYRGTVSVQSLVSSVHYHSNICKIWTRCTIDKLMAHWGAHHHEW